MTNRTENLRPEVKTLVELGNGVGGTKVSAADRATIKENLLRAFAISKELLSTSCPCHYLIENEEELHEHIKEKYPELTDYEIGDDCDYF